MKKSWNVALSVFVSIAGMIASDAIAAPVDTGKSANVPREVPGSWKPELFAYCVEFGTPASVKKHSLPEQLKILKTAGLDGCGYGIWMGPALEKNLRLADETGVKVHMFWALLRLKPDKLSYDARLPETIRKLKGRPVTICVLIIGMKPGDLQGIDAAVKGLRELGDIAAEAGVRISIYNHTSDWTQSVPFAAEVVRKVNHPQVGFNFNLCHYLKVEPQLDYRPILRENAAKLFCVTINGAKVGATGFHTGLIQPLDKGDFDHRPLLTLLREIGYRRPVGLMCEGIADDLNEHLGRSMAVWKNLITTVDSSK